MLTYHYNKYTFLNKKNLIHVKTAQKNALVKAFSKKNIPYREFQLRKINEVIKI